VDEPLGFTINLVTLTLTFDLLKLKMGQRYRKHFHINFVLEEMSDLKVKVPAILFGQT